ncbi:MAG: PLP-dependent aminotransferase family protein [Corynebacterium casei]|uniref:aminotransferase-like domain-containing protein n=1 Tax=Corynebacterium casei TaxID=160386 RepID=UPI00264968D8|nr:PLP-dependent aminotransferase family protein [Corynebacterium casei]MDN5729520.1 PLP-dependent aminotransferase family protein [Corynebacterium casei]MDN5840268.1 PLP-dependent aminotransferase family protein [Corynebacterium casei]MDN6154410.1 PLP-dependent aminotransferase family protein [Corynebacterium casei]MDN6273870.1 PLP-dependent aminotransferase family protein [Corynebacterium casei]MDN6415740.1 PLP-dependent aminotransferase family protein [Corynebacterium casei]
MKNVNRTNPLPLNERFATRAQFFAPSPIRAVFEMEMDEGVISLAGGNPELTHLPWPEITRITNDVVNQHGSSAFQYGTSVGHPELVQEIRNVMALEGIETNAADIIVTSGSQMSLDLVAKLFLNSGDTVLAAAPTYSGALNVFAGMEAHVDQLEGDEEGITIDALSLAITRAQEAGSDIKLLYVVSNFANPSGVMMSHQRRIDVAALCRAHGIVIIEDNPYGQVNFGVDAPPALRTIDPDNVIYLGSLSKTFSPGIRIGWADAPAMVHASLVPAAEASAICPSPLSQHIAAAYLREVDWQSVVASNVQMYKGRAQALDAALKEFMPEGCSWRTPQGGFFIWVDVPENIDTPSLLDEAMDEGILYIPGTAFFLDGRGRNSLRLAYSQVDEATLCEGARRLGAILQNALELKQSA